MNTKQLREKFITFFTSSPRNHKEIPSSSLVPENDPTVLFITAGMHPLVPYLMGEPHPLGKRLVDIQKSIRTDDIEEVGDLRHLTFFEMLGNWSLGDYFKKEAIEWSFEFLTGKKWLGLDPSRLYVSVFEGDGDAPADDESIQHWTNVFKTVAINATVGDLSKGVLDNRIFPYPKAKNWWGPAGVTGPCGPDTEMFFDTKLPLHDTKKHGPICHINCDCGRFLEIWNDVFMQYHKKPDGTFEPLSQKNVDTGMGMERMTAILAWLAKVIPEPDLFLTDLFREGKNAICALSGKNYEEPFKKSMRIILDHIRAVTFAISDGVEPANKERGYVVRKLIRRVVRHGQLLGIPTDFLFELAKSVVSSYREFYPQLISNTAKIKEILDNEERKFRSLLLRGTREIEKYKTLDGKVAFDLYQSFGFPLELTLEIAQERGQKIDKKTFEIEFEKHRNLSRTASTGVFKGGLQDHSEATIKLHTATHLLQAALRKILGDHVRQQGSHITAERLRFDFSHPKKLTGDEIEKVQMLVNDAIKKNHSISVSIVDLDEAQEEGALTVPGTVYPAKVKVYSIGDFSKEVCGGPHVDFTGRLGSFKIVKEEAAGSDSRRIYALLT